MKNTKIEIFILPQKSSSFPEYPKKRKRKTFLNEDQKFELVIWLFSDNQTLVIYVAAGKNVLRGSDD